MVVKSSSGQLYDTSAEELQSLTGKAGLPAAPISPLGSAGIGANKDQAKMVGTPAQKVPALRDAIQGASSLADTLRTSQVNKNATQEEKTKTAQAPGLGGLSSLESRVDEIKNNLFSSAAPVAAAPFDLSKVPVENQGLKEALSSLNQNRTDSAALLKANQALGRDASNLLTSDQLMASYGNSVAQTSANTENTQIANLRAGDLDFQDKQSLADALHMNLQDLNVLTLPQLVDKAKGVLAQDFPIAPAVDQFTGQAERAEAQQALRHASAVGLTSANSDVQKLAKELANPVSIHFGGQEVPMDQLLSSGAVTDYVQKYLDASPAEKQKMQAEEPGLTSFVDRNASILASATKEVTGNAEALKAIQAQRQGIGDLGDGASLSAKTLDLLVPSWNSLSTEKVSLPPLFSSPQFASLPAESKAGIANLVNTVASKDPSIAKQIASLPVDKLISAGLNVPGPALDKFLGNLDSVKQVVALTPQSSADEVAQSFGFSSTKELLDAYHQASVMQASGLFGDKDLGLEGIKNSLVLDSKGNLDSKATVNRLQQAAPHNFESYLNYQSPNSSKDTLGVYSPGQNKTFDLVKDVIEDGKITSTEYFDKIAPKISASNFMDFAPALSKGDKTVGNLFISEITSSANKGKPISDLVSVLNKKPTAAQLSQASALSSSLEGMAKEAEGQYPDLAAALRKQKNSLTFAIEAGKRASLVVKDKAVSAPKAAATKVANQAAQQKYQEDQKPITKVVETVDGPQTVTVPNPNREKTKEELAYEKKIEESSNEGMGY